MPAAKTEPQNAKERSASAKVTSRSDLILCSLLSLAVAWLKGMSPSGRSPMLSGERRIVRVNGMPITRNNTPAMAAPQRHPQAWTITLRIGAMRTPPNPKAALLTVMARARCRMNHVLINTIGACMNPPA
jgi:hypothetical protein